MVMFGREHRVEAPSAFGRVMILRGEETGPRRDKRGKKPTDTHTTEKL